MIVLRAILSYDVSVDREKSNSYERGKLETMITTATTTTVTSLAVATSLALLIVVALLGMLISKEIIGGKGEIAQRFSKALDIAIVPLALVFGVTVAMKLAELLG